MFTAAGLVPLFVVTFAPSRFDWGGGPPPWYAPGIVLGFVLGGLWLVYRVVGSLKPVSVDSTRVYVSQWIGAEAYPKEAVHSVSIDRESTIVGHNPVVLLLKWNGRVDRVAFLIAETLDQDDLGSLLGTPVIDPWDEERSHQLP